MIHTVADLLREVDELTEDLNDIFETTSADVLQISVDAKGPLLIRLKRHASGKYPVIYSFDKSYDAQIGIIESDGRVEVGDALVCINGNSTHNLPLNQINLFLVNSGAIKHLSFIKKSKICFARKLSGFDDNGNESAKVTAAASSPIKSDHQSIMMSILCDSFIDKEQVTTVTRLYGLSNPLSDFGEMPHLRGVVWRLLLSYIPFEVASWEEYLRKQRRLYDDLCDEFFEPMVCEAGKESVYDGSSGSKVFLRKSVDACSPDKQVSDSCSEVNSEVSASQSDIENKTYIPVDESISLSDGSCFQVSRVSSFYYSDDILPPDGQSPSVVSEERSSFSSPKQSVFTPRNDVVPDKDSMLLAFIEQDVIRTHPLLPFYSKSRKNQDSLVRILYVHAQLNKGLGYIQGMNEICGTLLYVFAAGGIACTENAASESGIMDLGSKPEVSSTLNHTDKDIRGIKTRSRSGSSDTSDPVFISECRSAECSLHAGGEEGYSPCDPHFQWDTQYEADTYHCFSFLMSELHDLFVVEMDHSEFGIQARMNEFLQLLELHEPSLYNVLSGQGIDPSFYGFRWITTLFSREFSLSNALRIWDTLFSQEPGGQRKQFISCLCATMVMVLKDELSSGDFTTNLSLLQSYPLHVSVVAMVHQAEELMSCHAGKPTALSLVRPLETPDKNPPPSGSWRSSRRKSISGGKSSTVSSKPTRRFSDGMSLATRGFSPTSSTAMDMKGSQETGDNDTGSGRKIYSYMERLYISTSTAVTNGLSRVSLSTPTTTPCNTPRATPSNTPRGSSKSHSSAGGVGDGSDDTDLGSHSSMSGSDFAGNASNVGVGRSSSTPSSLHPSGASRRRNKSPVSMSPVSRKSASLEIGLGTCPQTDEPPGSAGRHHGAVAVSLTAGNADQDPGDASGAALALSVESESPSLSPQKSSSISPSDLPLPPLGEVYWGKAKTRPYE